MSKIFQKLKSSKKPSIIESAQTNNVDGVRNVCRQTKRKSLTDTDSQGRTALHIAAKEGHSGIVEMLVQLGADANIRDNNGRTPLHSACAANSNFIGITRTLICDGKAQVSVVSNDGTTPLYYFIQQSVALQDYDLYLKTISLMLKKGADINAKTKQGESVLHIACANGKIDVIDFLLQNKAELESKTKYGETPLHFAIRCEKLLVVQFLLDKGANPCAESKFGSISDYCKQTSANDNYKQVIEDVSFIYQAKLMNERKKKRLQNHDIPKDQNNIDVKINIDTVIVKNLQLKGYELPKIMTAVYTLSNAEIPISDEQLVINEIVNGNQSRSNECNCCMDSEVNSVLVPCGHAAFCMDCAKTTCSENCIICGVRVEHIHHLYFQ